MDSKQLSLFPELDLESKEPLIHDPVSGKFINKVIEKKEEKPFLNKFEKQIAKVARQPDSRGTFQKLVKEDEANYKKEQQKKKVRVESMPERIERLHHIYDGGPKPKHLDDPTIIDYENFKQRPKTFNNSDPSSFPSDRDQRQKMSSWDLVLEGSRGDPKEMKEVRNTLKRAYAEDPKSLDERELKLIGRHKSQQYKPPEIKPVVHVPLPMYQKPLVPEKPLQQIIKEKADQKLALEQDAYDKEHGKFGIPKILRPE